MKKLNLLLFAIVGLTFNSCEDAYRITQAGEFSEAATFKTIADMNLYMLGVYNEATITSEIGATALLTDETAFGSQNAGQNRNTYSYIVNPEDTDGFFTDIWLSEYTLINRANRLIAGAARITPTAAELPEYNSIIAQAKALRAFGHFQLLTYFSPDISDNNALGCILMDHVPGILEKSPRNTNGEVFTLIESDLDFAANNLVDYTTGTAPNAHPWTFFSKNAINALRARMYLYRKNYPLALQYANAAIAAGPALTAATPVPGGIVGSGTPTSGWNGSFYSASAPTSPYRKMWQDVAQGEIILSFEQGTGKSTVGGQFYFNRSNLTGGPFQEIGRNLFNLLEQNNGANGSTDIRRYAFVDPTSKIDQLGYASATPIDGYYGTDTDNNYKTQDVLLIDKYPGKVGNELANDFKIFRTSEMYFIRAEALIAGSDLPGAAAAIKAVRDARTFRGPLAALPVYANATAALADVLYERRLELCFEGHRYIDLKRLGTPAGAGVDRYSRDCDAWNVPTCSVPVTDYRFTLPIPQQEINGNNNAQQNPGYL